ncbi:50S ribosomal protein L23 [Candidatus Pacearchaeota archaeon CG10_big_fil_rev_8_21_14_0_10_34_12]|nr:MAG: 50S ribosomal protein L23 [Candidatus Pacearchaeota archaeon CG10_big_fil_rev_8_21_14_0_10_34_12]
MKPLTTEKAIMLIERENILTFEVPREKTRDIIKKEVEEIFEVKVSNVKVLVKNGKKYAYIKLKKEFPAIDVATKLGLI